jgi:hypothetical protein
MAINDQLLSTAQHSLGQLCAAIGDRKQTLQHYAQARLGYIFLGNSQLAEDLQRRIEKPGKALLDFTTLNNLLLWLNSH